MSLQDLSASKPEKRKTSKGCGIVCLIPLLYLAILNLLPFLYTPPALTTQKMEVILKITTYMTATKRKHQLEDMRLTRHDVLEVFRNNRWIDETTILSQEEIDKGLDLGEELKNVHYNSAISKGDMILFYPAVSSFLPHPPGVVYSIQGKDPNYATQPRIKNLRPFIKINPNWYSSMAMRPRRFSGW